MYLSGVVFFFLFAARPLFAVLGDSSATDDQLRSLCIALLGVQMHGPPPTPPSSAARRSIATSPFALTPTSAQRRIRFSPGGKGEGEEDEVQRADEEGEEDEEEDRIPSSTPLRQSAGGTGVSPSSRFGTFPLPHCAIAPTKRREKKTPTTHTHISGP